jgi:mannonate dehydratase
MYDDRGQKIRMEGTLMFRIAEVLPPEPNLTWETTLQAGVTEVVGGLPFNDRMNRDDAPWDYMPLMRMKQRYNDAGFNLAVIEQRPPLFKAKRGQEGRDEEIDTVCTLLENMGRLGIPVWCYEWMADFVVHRTSRSIESRGGSLVTGYDDSLVRDEQPEQGPISEEELWDNLRYFLERVIPVAEKAGVTLAMHPDDPPLSPTRGVSRIMCSVENYQRLVDMVPSPVNQIGLCQGNFTLMTDDLPGVIRHFGNQGKIAFVHFRDVAGTADNFVETWHDNGKTDMLECIRAYRDVGYDGVMRTDHVPTLVGEDPNQYSAYAALYAIGYLRGLRETVYREKQ